MMQAGGHPVDWVMLLASAVLAAPLVEELLFRGALLPYLVGHPQRSSVAMGAVILYGIPFGVGPTVLAVVLALGLPLLSTPVMRAIWASAAAFAVMHGNVWPTPVPLFLLALGLGLAARISGGLLAAIVIHALFNLTTCLAMAVP
jgi:membrane protease YdiL (CAAX protease family)